LEALENEFKTNSDIAGVIVEGIQGVGESHFIRRQTYYFFYLYYSGLSGKDGTGKIGCIHQERTCSV
jgi:hypothetical protein